MFNFSFVILFVKLGFCIFNCEGWLFVFEFRFNRLMLKNYVEESILLCMGINDCCFGMNIILLMIVLY